MRRYILVLLFLSTTALAQQRPLTVIEGEVTDAQGRPLPGVTITITAEGDCCECECSVNDILSCCSDDSKLCCGDQSAVTDDKGSFSFRKNGGGTWTINAQLEGFASASQRVVLQRGVRKRVSIKLSAAAGGETITVHGSLVTAQPMSGDSHVRLILAPADCCDCTCKTSGGKDSCCTDDARLCCSNVSAIADVKASGAFTMQVQPKKFGAAKLALYHTRIDPKTKLAGDIVINAQKKSVGTIEVPADAVVRVRKAKR